MARRYRAFSRACWPAGQWLRLVCFAPLPLRRGAGQRIAARAHIPCGTNQPELPPGLGGQRLAQKPRRACAPNHPLEYGPLTQGAAPDTGVSGFPKSGVNLGGLFDAKRNGRVACASIAPTQEALCLKGSSVWIYGSGPSATSPSPSGSAFGGKSGDCLRPIVTLRMPQS